MTCGIYLIQNKTTKQKYIGQSINIERRWKQHCRKHDRNNSRIDNAIGKYGKNNFELIIIEETSNDTDILNKREQYWINYYNTYKNPYHYNLTLGGDDNPMKYDAARKKVALSKMGIKNPNYKKKYTLNERKEISNRTSGVKNGMYNKKHTDDSKIKMSSKKNQSGFLGVYYLKTPSYKQGFCFCYESYQYGFRKSFTSSSLQKLKDKVVENKYKWVIVDNEKAQNFMKKHGRVV